MMPRTRRLNPRRYAAKTLLGLGMLVCLPTTVVTHTGCSLSRLFAQNSGPLLKGTLSVLRQYEDPELAERGAPGLIILLEGLLAQDPENKALLELLGRGIYEYTFAFLQGAWDRWRESDPDKAEIYRRRARVQYLRVYRIGLRLLAAHDVKLTLSVNDPSALRRQVAKLEKKRYVAGLTLTAIGAGGALLMGLESAELMQLQNKVPILLRRARALDPTYAQALPDAVLGLFYARSVTLGGDAAKSKRHFERAIRLTKRKYLMWLVLYAKHWAWQFQSAKIPPRDKRALFVALLDEVKRAKLSGDPERLANTLAKRRALRLYPKRSEFLSAEPVPTPRPAPRRAPPLEGSKKR